MLSHNQNLLIIPIFLNSLSTNSTSKAPLALRSPGPPGQAILGCTMRTSHFFPFPGFGGIGVKTLSSREPTASRLLQSPWSTKAEAKGCYCPLQPPTSTLPGIHCQWAAHVHDVPCSESSNFSSTEKFPQCTKFTKLWLQYFTWYGMRL